MWTIMRDNCSPSCPLIDALANVRDELVTEMSTESARFDLRMVSLARGIIGFGVTTFAEVCLIAVAAPPVVWEIVVAASCAMGVRTGAIIEVMPGTLTDAARGIHVDV